MEVLFKYLVIGMLALILISLGSALFHLSSPDPAAARKMLRALSWRIGLSVGLFLLVILAYYMGWIDPLKRP